MRSQPPGSHACCTASVPCTVCPRVRVPYSPRIPRCPPGLRQSPRTRKRGVGVRGSQALPTCCGARCCCFAWRARSFPQVRLVGVGALMPRTFAEPCPSRRSRLPVDGFELHHFVAAAARPAWCALPLHGVPCCRALTAVRRGCQGCRVSRAARTCLTTRSSRPRAASMLLCSAGAPESLVFFTPTLTALRPRRNAQGAVLVSPHATGARFTMYLLNLGAS